jgi:uncharacterized coiled-coil protein SlyX
VADMKNKITILSLTVIVCLLLGSLLFSYNSIQTINAERAENHLVVSSLEKTVEELNLKLTTYDKSLEEVNARIEFLENKDEFWDTVSQEYSSEIAKLWHLFDKMPGVTKRMGFVRDSEVEDGMIYITLDYAEWFSGDEAIKAAKEDSSNDEDVSLPNGFYIRNSTVENDVKKVEENTLIYVLEGATLKGLEFKDLPQYLSTEHEKLFWFYEIDDEVVIMTEQYRP